jgi:nicotinamide-nucleotide amidase
MDLIFPSDLLEDAARLLSALSEKKMHLSVAESCTGGLIAALLTEIAGSSSVFDRGFVTYSNEAKTDLVGVPAALIALHGAVSEPVARAMAKGAVNYSQADVGFGVTGIAGPGGGTLSKPVGLVHMATHQRCGITLHQECQFGNIGRSSVRINAVRSALALLQHTLAD